MKLNQFSLPFMLLLLLLSVASNSVLGSIAQISRHCIGQALLGLSITTTTDNEFITPTISYYDSSSSTSSYSLPPESDNWSFGSSRSYIYGGKQALYALSKQISESQSSSSPSSSSMFTCGRPLINAILRNNKTKTLC